MVSLRVGALCGGPHVGGGWTGGEESESVQRGARWRGCIGCLFECTGGEAQCVQLCRWVPMAGGTTSLASGGKQQSQWSGNALLGSMTCLHCCTEVRGLCSSCLPSELHCAGANEKTQFQIEIDNFIKIISVLAIFIGEQGAGGEKGGAKNKNFLNVGGEPMHLAHVFAMLAACHPNPVYPHRGWVSSVCP